MYATDIKIEKKIHLFIYIVISSPSSYSSGESDLLKFSETREKNENFGSSLLLANSPMSPKIVNGSFAAIYDAADVFNECMKTFGQLRLEARDSPGTRYCMRVPLDLIAVVARCPVVPFDDS